MTPWRILEYVTADGISPVQDWYEAQEDGVRAAFDNVILLLRAVEDWLNPERVEFANLKREHVGLSEVRFWFKPRFLAKHRKFRVAGLYRPDEREFVLLVGCEKRLRSLYIPRDPFDLAMTYKQHLEVGEGGLREHV